MLQLASDTVSRCPKSHLYHHCNLQLFKFPLFMVLYFVYTGSESLVTVKMGHDYDCRKFGTKSLKMNCLSQIHFKSPFFQHSKHAVPVIIPSNRRGLAACIYHDSLPVCMSLLKAGPYPEVAQIQLGSKGAVVVRIKKVLWSAYLIRALHCEVGNLQPGEV